MLVTLATLAILAYAGLISAIDICAQQAKSDPTPNCNAIHLPGLHDVVPGGKPYTIRWGNNTGTFVSLVLCQGDSTKLQEILCIKDHIPNTGSIVWTPPTDLVPDGNHNYGLKIIADTRDFQWSDQFGISNSISTSSSPTPATTPTSSKKAARESAKAVKESAKAVTQASDGQNQEPTGTVKFKEHHTKNISNTVSHEPKTHDHQSNTLTSDHTHARDHAAKPFATGKHLSAHFHEKGANATYILKLQKSKSHASPSVITTSVTESVTPTVVPSVPTTLPPTTVAPSTVAPSTSVKTSFSGGGAARAAATGVPLVLGAIAILVL